MNEDMKQDLRDMGIEALKVAKGIIVVGTLAIVGAMLMMASKEESKDASDSIFKIFRMGKNIVQELKENEE